MSSIAATPALSKRWKPWGLLAGGTILTAAGVFVGTQLTARPVVPPPTSTAAMPTATPPVAADDRVSFSAERQQAAGIKLAEAADADIVETVVVTGKLAVDEDRLAHIYSFVDGVLRETAVRLGQEVKAGDLLAVVDSKEVGRAKLELAKNRMNAGFAKTNREWAQTIHDNTQAMIDELQKRPDVNELEAKFRNQPMGDNRQMLVSAYSKFHQTEADYLRLKTLREQNVGVEKDFIRAKADYESAAATYQALLEQLKFTTARLLREAEQKLQEALTEERMSRAELLILGFDEKVIDALDPLTEGEAVAHYPIHAPFAGTIINKHAVLSEFVGPQHQLYEIADLSKVWIHADVFEKDLAALARMTSKTLTFRAAGYPDREFTADIFHTGDAVDEKTRAVTLIAAADNPEGLLKPGMFVEVVLPVGTARRVVQIPTTAVQHESREAYVFVAAGGEAFERRPIRTGRTVGGVVEVVDGLKPGERVVVEGGFALKSEMLRDQLVE